jgi:hypothetical protein
MTYFAHRPKPMRREVTPRRLRARSKVLGAIPAHSASASTWAVGRSPPASSARSQATATSILFGPDIGVWRESLEALRWGFGISTGEADLVSVAGENARAALSRRPRGCGSKLPGLELRLARQAVCSSGQSQRRVSFGELRGDDANDLSYQVVWIWLLSQAKFQSPEPSARLPSTAIGSLPPIAAVPSGYG